MINTISEEKNMKKQTLVALVVTPLLAFTVVSTVRSQTAQDKDKPGVFSRFFGGGSDKDKSDSYTFATSVARFFPGAHQKVIDVFKQAADNPESFTRGFAFREDTPFIVTVEGPKGRVNYQATFKDLQEAMFAVVPKDQHLFVAASMLGIASGFKEACNFVRLAPDGHIVFAGFESTGFTAEESSPVAHGTFTMSPPKSELAARFIAALNGKVFQADYGVTNGEQAR